MPEVFEENFTKPAPSWFRPLKPCPGESAPAISDAWGGRRDVIGVARRQPLCRELCLTCGGTSAIPRPTQWSMDNSMPWLRELRAGWGVKIADSEP